ncbi:SRPBCC domain-containing protein [Pseudoclavibacter helvolus]
MHHHLRRRHLVLRPGLPGGRRHASPSGVPGWHPAELARAVHPVAARGPEPQVATKAPRAVFTPSIDISVRIKAPAELIWQALVDEDLRELWWADSEFKIKRGAKITARSLRPGKKKPRITSGNITKIDAPEELHFTWKTKAGDFETNVVLVVVQQKDKKSKVRVLEQGFPRGDYAEIHVAKYRDGWREHLLQLQELFEDGPGRKLATNSLKHS